MPKQLVEYLEEKQQPFVLEAFLVKKPYNNNNSRHKFMKGFLFLGRIRFHDNKKLIPNCSKIVRGLFRGRFVPAVNNTNVVDGDHHQEVEEEVDNLSSPASSSTVFHSCSDCYMEEARCESSTTMVDADEKMGSRRGVEDDNQQLSPVSVLEEITQSDNDASPILNRKQPREFIKRTNTGPPTQKLEKPFIENEDIHDSKFVAHYTKNKRAVLQSNQFLFDCMRESVDKETVTGVIRQHRQFHTILGAEQLWKLVHENIWLWSKDEPMHEANVNQLSSHFDLLEIERGRCSQQLKDDISIRIGDAIFKDTIGQMIEEMTDFV